MRGLALVVLAACLVGCGGGGGGSAPKVPGNGDPADVAVIQGWVGALDRGDVDGAAAYFATPSVAVNGALPLRITSRAQARAFNATLPCGANVIRATSNGRVTTATFRLSERPGPGECGAGDGGLARTAFVISDGKIVQWRRVPLRGGGTAPSGPAV